MRRQLMHWMSGSFLTQSNYRRNEIRLGIQLLRCMYRQWNALMSEWRQSRCEQAMSRSDDWMLDMNLTEQSEEFDLHARRLVVLCDAWFAAGGHVAARDRFNFLIQPYLQSRLMMMKEWNPMNETFTRSALLETIVTELIAFPAFTGIERDRFCALDRGDCWAKIQFLRYRDRSWNHDSEKPPGSGRISFSKEPDYVEMRQRSISEESL